MASVFLCLGTNIGNRKENLEKALDRLSEHMTILKQSEPIVTDPQYEKSQPFFLNMVIKAETTLPPKELLQTIQSTEVSLGRTKSWKYGPRIIDIDILYYEHLIIHEPDLTIPHPLIPERRFVLQPISEIEPDFVCPVTQRTISEMLNTLNEETA